MKMSAPPDTVYVASSLTHLLMRFLDVREVPAPALRERLARLAPSPRIPITVWWDLLDEVQSHFPQEPALGLQIGNCTQAHHVGVLGYLYMHSTTLGQALLRFSQFQRLLHNLVPSVIAERDGQLVIGWGKADHLSTRLSDEVLTAGLLAFARQVTGRPDVQATRVFSIHPAPDDLAAYERALGCPVQFGCAESAMHLPAWVMDLPIDSQDPHLSGLLEQQATSLLKSLPEHDAWLSALKQQIVAALQDGSADTPAVAGRMGMSERTFYRVLQDRGLRYKQVLNALRQELSQDYLRDPLLSLPEIALLLGYAEQSVFSRAFKAWTGNTPLKWRRQVLSEATVTPP